MCLRSINTRIHWSMSCAEYARIVIRKMRHILLLILLIFSCNLVVAQDESRVDSNVGVQYELGQARGWKRVTDSGIDDSGYKAPSATGHNWQRFIINTGASVVVAYGAKSALKGMIKEERPDHSDNKSFPSGHAAMAFAAARSIDKEFRKENIWIPIAGYAAATAVGIERIASERHHWYDVVAGAAVGIGSAELTWWLSDKLLGTGKNLAVGASGNTVDVVYSF